MSARYFDAQNEIQTLNGLSYCWSTTIQLLLVSQVNNTNYHNGLKTLWRSIYLMEISAVKSSREEYKIRKGFWLKINCSQTKLLNLLLLEFFHNINFIIHFIFWNYRVSHSKLCKVNWLWWGCTIDFFLLREVLCIPEKLYILPI